MNGPPVTGRGLFKHYDDLRDQAEAAEEATASAIVSGVRPEELQVCHCIGERRASSRNLKPY